MKLEIIHREIRNMNISKYIILILVGILITSLIFALSIKAFAGTGIWVGLLVNGALVFLGFNYTEKGSKIRPIIWSMLIMIAVLIILFLTGISIVSSALEGF